MKLDRSTEVVLALLLCINVKDGVSLIQRTTFTTTAATRQHSISATIDFTDEPKISNNGDNVGKFYKHDLNIYDKSWGVNETIFEATQVPELEYSVLKQELDDFVVVEIPLDEELNAYTPPSYICNIPDPLKRLKIENIPLVSDIQTSVANVEWQKKWLSEKEARYAINELNDLGKGLFFLGQYFDVENLIIFQKWLIDLSKEVHGKGAETKLKSNNINKATTSIQNKLLLPISNSLDKDGRTSLHKVFKDYFSYLDTKTLLKNDEKGPQQTFLDIRFMPKNRTYRSWPKDRPAYLEFSVYKWGRGTQDAINIISRVLNINSSRISYAGSKDKFAITAQKMRCWKLEAEDILSCQEKLLKENIAVSDFVYVADELNLGQLKGNSFHIHLRLRKEMDSAHIQFNISNMKFVNYFGPQRFGKTAVSNCEIGKSILKQDWAKALNQLLMANDGDPLQLIQAKEKWNETKDAKLVLDILPKRFFLEHYLFSALLNHRTNDPLSVIRSLPRFVRQLFGQSYQSLLWNSAVSSRLKMSRSDAILGDLVLLDNGTQEPLSGWDCKWEHEIQSEYSPNSDVSNSNLSTKGRGLSRWKKRSSSMKKDSVGKSNIKLNAVSSIRVHMVDEEDIESRRFGIEHVVLPLPGCRVEFPSHSAGTRMLHRLFVDEVHETVLGGHPQSEFTLKGSYRHMMIQPKNFKLGSDEFDQSTLGAYFKALSHKSLDGETRKNAVGQKLKISFDLPSSSYATTFMAHLVKNLNRSEENYDLI